MKRTIIFLLSFLIIYGCTPQDAPDELPVGAFVDTRDGNIYLSVKIGNQVWMARNLAYLPSVSSRGEASQTNKHYYVYDYEDNSVLIAKLTTNYKVYGVLYNWEAALTACPTGWHLPTDAEWTILSDYLGGENVAGGKMKQTGTTYWDSPNTGATNISGFTALPGGCIHNYASPTFYFLGDNAVFWSSSQYYYNSNYAHYRYLSSSNAKIVEHQYWKGYGLSVRCVKN
jgi:uncharacterized protein (TIGR02145 family)